MSYFYFARATADESKEIYRIVSSKALDNNEGPQPGVSAGAKIDITPSQGQDNKKSNCC